MPTYRNGYIPRDLLVRIASGTNSDVGYWEHLLSPATYARHLALVKRARDRAGKTLAMGAGWSAYRPYDQQVRAREIYGNGAAQPGTSSHGGFWEGRQTLAMDYSNWSSVYGGDRATFYADCRAVGLEPGLIEPRRGYPDEPWHVVDGQPWSAVPAYDGVFTPFLPEEEDMTPEQDAMLRDIQNKLSIKGAGYGRPEVIQQRVDAIVEKLETGAGYDWLPAIANQGHAILAAVGGLNVTAAPVDVQALADALREGLGAAIASELAERLANG